VKVKTGERFLLIDDLQKDWFKIEYVASQSGWISSQYAKKTIP